MSFPTIEAADLESDVFIKLAFEVVIKVIQSPYGRERYALPFADLMRVTNAVAASSGPSDDGESLLFIPGA